MGSYVYYVPETAEVIDSKSETATFNDDKTVEADGYIIRSFYTSYTDLTLEEYMFPIVAGADIHSAEIGRDGISAYYADIDRSSEGIYIRVYGFMLDGYFHAVSIWSDTDNLDELCEPIISTVEYKGEYKYPGERH